MIDFDSIPILLELIYAKLEACIHCIPIHIFLYAYLPSPFAMA